MAEVENKCFLCGYTAEGYKHPRKRIVCIDGATVSVQASCAHYSLPRACVPGKYFKIEAGFPSVAPPESWMEHCEDVGTPTETVYGYMPTGLVWEFVRAHGGLSEESRDGLNFIPAEEDE